MKVIHICQSADPNIGGSLIAARSLAREQNTLGHEASLLFLYASTYDFQSKDLMKQYFLDAERSTRYTSGIRKLMNVLRNHCPDVIHHHDGLLWPRLATARLGVPLVTHGHLGSPTSWWFSIDRFTHRFISKHTHRLIAISEWVAESWVASGYPREKVRLIPNGVDTGRFRPRSLEKRNAQLLKHKIDPNMKILLWVGRLDRDTKGLDRLLLITKHLPAEWCCLIVGDGADRNWLATELKTQGKWKKQVIMLGKVDDPEQWFGAADAFIFTSKNESFGLVLLEAAASELPILSFRCEGGGIDLLELLGAQLIDETDVIDIATILSMKKMLEPAKDTRRLVQDQFSWNIAAMKTIEVYHELVTF